MSKIYTQLSDYIANTKHLLDASKETIAIATWYEARLSRQPEIGQLKARIKELENILKDFLTTSCSQTWIEEMKATISDVLDKEQPNERR